MNILQYLVFIPIYTVEKPYYILVAKIAAAAKAAMETVRGRK